MPDKKDGRLVADSLIMNIIVPLLLLLIFSAVIWVGDLDRRLAHLFYDKTIPFGWIGFHRFPWNVIYDIAPIPALVISINSLVVLLVVCCRNCRLYNYRRVSLFYILLLIIGPGLIVNSLFKENYGRARPNELVEFGGKYEYTQIWERGQVEKNSSFPSGHSAVAFFSMAPWFYWRKKNKRRAVAWLSGGIGFGFLVGLARMLQGGHFLSDVLWSGGIVYITGAILSYLLIPKDPPRHIECVVPEK